MPAHVFNVPKPYKAQEPPQEKARSKFRWFGHSVRLGSSSKTPPTSTNSTKDADDSHRRTKSSYVSTAPEPVSPTASSRSASFSSTTSSSQAPPFASKGLTDSFSLHKLHFSLLRSGHSSSPTGSVRTSIASTASSSEDAPFSLASSTSSSSSSDHDRPADDNQIHSPRIEYETRKLLRQVMGMDAVWTDDAHVQRHFERLQWRVVRIEADGNCLFRAISDQIYRNEAFYGDIRRRIVEFIDREKELFQPFVENEEKDTHEPIGAYCTRMKKDAQWGGNPELYAAARLFNVHVVVHQGPLRRLRIENGSQTPHMELHLLYRNDHYDSLHDETQLDDKPRLSITAALALDDETEKECRAEEELLVEEPLVEQTEKKKKKRKKGVVFLGEETRVERVDVDSLEFVPPPVVMRMPVRAVVRYGKVCDPVDVVVESNQDEEDDEEQYESQQEIDQVWDESEQTLSFPEEEESSVAPVEQDNQTETKDAGLPVVPIKKVSFRRGRRVAV